MGLIYQLGVRVYALLLWLATGTNRKAKLWIDGRKGLSRQLNALPEMSNVWWFHCASLGEFEQARPLIEQAKTEHSDISILVTFFSPSGYEVRKDYELADHVMYLPVDTRSRARMFIQAVNPSKVIFIKYEFWFNFLGELHNRSIPTFLAAGVFHTRQVFFKSWGGWARKQLRSFTHFFLQDENSAELLKKLGYSNFTIAGDTRYDRVKASAQKAQPVREVEAFLNGADCWIAGSTWPADEEIILSFFDGYQGPIKLILAPHEVDESHIEGILKMTTKKTVRFSQLLNGGSSDGADILVIDNIGYLSNIYQYGQLAYIGGAFHGALHNILEAVTFGLPVIFGPEYNKFPEAKALIEQGGAFSVTSAGQLEATIEEIDVIQTSAINRKFIDERLGATSSILSAISS